MNTHRKKYRATILFDMDEVIAEMLPAWIDVYNELYEDDLQLENITDWDTSKLVKPECGMNIYELLKEPGLFRNLNPLPHSQEVIQRLIDNNFEIVIVSDSPQGNAYCDYQSNNELVGNPADDKRKWLQEHFPMIPMKNVVFTSQKWRVMGDILIDDKPETFEIFQELGRNALLMDMPYNRFIETKHRVHTLLDVEKTLYDMYPEK